MKNLKEKFKNKINFVKPLYRKVKPISKTPKQECVSVDIDNTIKLCGNDINVKRHIRKSFDKNPFTYKNITERHRCRVPIVYEKNGDNPKRRQGFTVRNVKKNNFVSPKMLGIAETKIASTEVVSRNGDKKKYKPPDTWLRVCPAPRLPKESVCSLMFRWLMCQLGLALFLTVWTVSWMMLIHHFEGPYEQKVSRDFQREQNQLVIELATELRQITPLSPKWRKSIEDRIEAERQLTIAAVGKGARLHPGHFWDTPGTFLFMVYVMTALGFGAPVPQTLWGRTSTLFYAIIAVPAHLYLMVHVSTCVVVYTERLALRITGCFNEKMSFEVGKSMFDNKKGSPNNSKNSELMKSNRNAIRRKIICVLGVICAGRGVPLAVFLYYLLGVAAFGLARAKKPLEVVMFPLEFTTGGGLEHVECYIRILYGFYVVGAVVLLSCALATIRRHSTGPANKMADRYRLFTGETEGDTNIRMRHRYVDSHSHSVG